MVRVSKSCREGTVRGVTGVLCVNLRSLNAPHGQETHLEDTPVRLVPAKPVGKGSEGLERPMLDLLAIEAGET